MDDPKGEMERLEKQNQKEQQEVDKQYDPFGQQNQEEPNQENPDGDVDEE